MLSINYLSNYLNNNQEMINRYFIDNINVFEKKYKEINNSEVNNLEVNNSEVNNLEVNSSEVNSSEVNNLEVNSSEVNDLEVNSSEVNNLEVNSSEVNENNIDLLNKFNIKLFNSFEVIFKDKISNFYFDNKIYKNRSKIFTLINSIFNIIDETFNLYDLQKKEETIKDFIKEIDNNLFKNCLYTKFNYARNKLMNKIDLQSEIKNALQFNCNEKNYLLKKYISDYLGINLCIINVENELIFYDKCEYYMTKKYGNNINKYLPFLLIIYDKEIYKPILSFNKELNNSSVLVYTKYTEIINNLSMYFLENDNKQYINESINSKYKIDILKNLKMDHLKKLCIENNIELQKMSEKTSKMINKIKIDLINDLLNIGDDE